MHYHLHTTDGIIIARREVGEASWWCRLLTREYGLVGVRSQGTRELSSKLRPHVQLFTRGSFTLVYGKRGWRLTHAQRYANLATENPDAAQAFGRVASLIKILIAGEERNVHLYDVVENAFTYACRHDLSVRDLGALERLVVLRVLYHLGYVGESAMADAYHRDTHVTQTHIEETHPLRRDMIRLINASLKETQI